MRAIFKITWLFLAVVMFPAVSCNLVDVTDVRPVNQLSDEEVIANISQAQNVLYGTYGLLNKGLEFIDYMPGIASMMGLTMQPGSFSGTAEAEFFNNDVNPDNYMVESIYTKAYEVINNANHVISKTEKLATDNVRKSQIIGEAKYIRALCNFYLLRLFGEFYDMQSAYGIVLRREPVSDAVPVPRSSVKECYDLILSDLDDAISDAPAFSSPFYASRLSAKATKAKVLLYMQQYQQAAELANEVIDLHLVSLENDYADIFRKKTIDTREVIFQTPFDNTNERNNKAFIFRAYFIPSDYYAGVMKEDTRDSAALERRPGGALRNNKFNGSMYGGEKLTADTEYFLRLDEVYLILAEAMLRSAGTPDGARGALNMIRRRAGMPDVTGNDKAALLEDIRKEKILELGAENGEEWFDLIRYATQGDLDIRDFKPGFPGETHYILPLPFKTVQLSNGVIKQNSGY